MTPRNSKFEIRNSTLPSKGKAAYKGRSYEVRFADADELSEMKKLAAAKTRGGSLNQWILHLVRMEMEKA